MQATTASSFAGHRARLQNDLLAGYDELIARTTWDRERILTHQRERLRGLLRWAMENSPFHAERLAGVDPDRVEPDDLSALPVMTKTDLMNQFDRVVTEPRISLERVEAALAAVDSEPAQPVDSVIAMTSGGTAGPRGVFLLDAAAARQFFGSVSRGLVARLRVTGTPPGGLRIAFVGAASPVHATAMAAVVTAGGTLPFFFESVPVTLPLPEIVDRLNRMQPAALYGYPTVLARLAMEQDDGTLRIAPMSVSTTSETCTPELRSTITTGFGAPLLDSFATTEGLVGGTLPDDDVFVFAEDGCIVELVDGNDRPVPPGTPSDAVLVTVLENRLQPLLRYRISDTFVEQPPVAGHGYLRARVQGRSDDLLRFGAVTVHPLVVRSVLVQRPEVLDYQVRQTARGIAVDVVAPRGLDCVSLGAELRDALVRAGLPGAEATVRAVPGLPRDDRTGKVRRFLPSA